MNFYVKNESFLHRRGLIKGRNSSKIMVHSFRVYGADGKCYATCRSWQDAEAKAKALREATAGLSYDAILDRMVLNS